MKSPCGHESDWPEYPCDRVDCTIERMIRDYPNLSANRTQALMHLLTLSGNGYEWAAGALVDVHYRLDSDAVREERAVKPSKVLEPYIFLADDDPERAEMQAAYEAEVERLRGLRANAAELARTPGPLEYDVWEYARMCQRVEVFKERMTPKTPADVRDDWQAAADELAGFIGPLREQVLARAADAETERIETSNLLYRAANAYKNDARLAAPGASWALGALLSTLARQGHDVHEHPLWPPNTGVWACTACGNLDVRPERCPGFFAGQVARAAVDGTQPSRLDILRSEVRMSGGEWTTARARGVPGLHAVTAERARQLLNTLADEGLLVRHGERGRLWTPPER